ncbi:hypothetical protein DFH11DRAFT_383668 [Phellopilus nigrolimitatus]|nr:hypothetical protein DFH11DRAFT_383668 [Phellopilus nigrolimitatus]
MYRHPFANPEHAYDRVGSVEYDRRVASPGPNPYRSFMPMASQSTFSVDAPRPPNSFPPFREHSGVRHARDERDRRTHTEETNAAVPAWKRALKRMRRRARRGLQKVRAMLHIDGRR